MRMHTIFLTNRQVSVFTPSNRSGTIASDIIGSRFVNFLSKLFPSTSTNKPQTWAVRRWTATWGKMKRRSVKDNFNWIWQWNWPKRNHNNDSTEVTEIPEAKRRYHRWFTIEHLVYSSVLVQWEKIAVKNIYYWGITVFKAACNRIFVASSRVWALTSYKRNMIYIHINIT